MKKMKSLKGGLAGILFTAGLKPFQKVRSLQTEFPMLPFLTERENS